MQNYAIKNKLTPFISMQNHYSLLYREEEREMVPTLKVRPKLRFADTTDSCAVLRCWDDSLGTVGRRSPRSAFWVFDIAFKHG